MHFFCHQRKFNLRYFWKYSELPNTLLDLVVLCFCYVTITPAHYCISIDCIYFFPLLLFGLCLVNAYVNLQNIDFSIVCMCVHLCECRDVLYKFFINILLLLFSCVLLKTKFSIANNVIETKKCKKCCWNNLDMNEIASILSYHWVE